MMVVKNVLAKTAGFALMFAALASVANATPPSAPEIDPGALASAMTLLASGAFVLSRKAKKS